MKAPVFAYGRLEALKAAVAKGKIKYPTYAWLSDTTQYAFVNKQKEIEIVGLPKLTGTLDHQIVLSNLDDGVYEIKGQYVVVEGYEPTFLSASYIIVIISSDGDKKFVRRITQDVIDNYTIENGTVIDSDLVVTVKYLTDNGYATDQYVDDKIAALRVSLENELKDYVDDIIMEQIAELVPEEVDKIFSPVSTEDIIALFESLSKE